MYQEVYREYLCCLPVEVRDGELEDGGKTHPGEVGEVEVGYPGCKREDDYEGPDECHQDEKDIDGGEQVTLEAEL